jgi:dihydropteroate synthase
MKRRAAVVIHSTFNIQRSTFNIEQLKARPAVMGILNITPDSFSDGGVHFDQSKAVHAALQMEEDGAAIIDIGGESTRPGAELLLEHVEIDRVLPVIEQIRRRSAVPISIDTRKAAVAEEAIGAGADLVNDVSAMRYSAGMAAVVAKTGVPVILMHMRGEPATMQQFAVYDDVVTDVGRELSSMIDDAVEAGVDPGKILIDPGIGFAKTFDQNLELLARAHELTALGPVVIGASRKAFIGHLTGRPSGPDRALGSLAAVAAAQRAGAAIVRVHDVRATVDFLKVLLAIEAKR